MLPGQVLQLLCGALNDFHDPRMLDDPLQLTRKHALFDLEEESLLFSRQLDEADGMVLSLLERRPGFRIKADNGPGTKQLLQQAGGGRIIVSTLNQVDGAGKGPQGETVDIFFAED